MARHFILEIDESSLRLTVAELHRKRVQVQASRIVELSSMDGSALVFALHDVFKDQEKEGAKVHLVLSDPNFLHFDLQVPRLELVDLDTVMKREARRLGSIPDEDEVLLGSRRIQKLGRRTWRHAIVALPSSSLQPIQDALAREGLMIASVTSVEEAAVRLLPEVMPEATLYLDHGAGRIRFVYVEQGVITQRRHILAPGLDDKGGGDEGGFWVEQLSMEIGWNLDYLADMGKDRPTLIALSMDLDLSDDQIETIRGELPFLPFAHAVFEAPDGPLTQATQGILKGLIKGGGISIYRDGTEKRPHDRRLVLATVLSGALCLASLAGAGWILELDGRVQEGIERTQRQLEAVQVEQQAIAEELDAIEQHEERARLRTVLGLRRPFSLLLAEYCRKVPTGISLKEISVQPDGLLVVKGRAIGPDRLGSLDLVKAYRQGIEGLEFLQEVRERVERFEGEEAWLDFRILARWRKDG